LKRDYPGFIESCNKYINRTKEICKENGENWNWRWSNKEASCYYRTCQGFGILEVKININIEK
jgi:hypothetical protein